VDGIAVRRRLRAQGSKWPALSEACQIATACGSPKPRERALPPVAPATIERSVKASADKDVRVGVCV